MEEREKEIAIAEGKGILWNSRWRPEVVASLAKMFREADEILEQAIRTPSQENNQASGRGAQYYGVVPSIEREDRGAYIPLPL